MVAPAPSYAPLTDRVLRALPGPRVAWIGAWALLGPLRIVALVVVLAATNATPPKAVLDSAISLAILGYVILVALWTSSRFSRRVAELEPTLQRIAPSLPPDAWSRSISSVRGPALLSALVVVASVPSTLAEFGPVVAAMDIVLLFVVILPPMTMLWQYGTLLFWLDRLGRAELVLDGFPGDRALGLSAVGGLAMSGLWPILIAGVPTLLLAGSDVPTLVTGATALAIAVGLFVLSMTRLHGQLRRAKAGHLAMARALIAEAYAPVRGGRDLGSLEASSSALSAAYALADRADRILEWPIDERMITLLTVVVTGVVTSIIVKVVLQALGV